MKKNNTVKAYGACFKGRKVIPHTVRHLKRKVWIHLIDSLDMIAREISGKYLSPEARLRAIGTLKEEGWSVIPVDLVWGVK